MGCDDRPEDDYAPNPAYHPARRTVRGAEFDALKARVEKLEKMLEGIKETHNLWDGS